jgi:hypothetical protein
MKLTNGDDQAAVARTQAGGNAKLDCRVAKFDAGR